MRSKGSTVLTCRQTTEFLTQALSISFFDSAECFPAAPVPADHHHLSAERIPIASIERPKALQTGLGPDSVAHLYMYETHPRCTHGSR